MLPVSISLFTAVAGVVFGIALLWVMTQWLKADQASASAEQDVRKGIKRLQKQAMVLRTAAEAPMAQSAALDRYGDPFPGTPGSSQTIDDVDEEAAAEAVPLADDETALSRLLLGWGASGMVLGLVIGALSYGAPGATIGGVLGSAVAIVIVVIGVLVLDRIGAKKPEQGE